MKILPDVILWLIVIATVPWNKTNQKLSNDLETASVRFQY